MFHSPHGLLHHIFINPYKVKNKLLASSEKGFLMNIFNFSILQDCSIFRGQSLINDLIVKCILYKGTPGKFLSIVVNELLHIQKVILVNIYID